MVEVWALVVTYRDVWNSWSHHKVISLRHLLLSFFSILIVLPSFILPLSHVSVAMIVVLYCYVILLAIYFVHIM